MMRVLHVIPSVARIHGGPSRALRQMETALRGQGMAVFTATTDDDGPGRRLALAAREPGRHYARKWTDFYKIAPGLLIWLWRHAREHDVIHIHALFSFSSVVAAWVARWRGVPYVIRPLGTLATYGVSQRRPWLKRLSLRLVEGPILRHAAAVHFTSQSEVSDASRLGLPCHGVVIPLAVTAVSGAPFPRLRTGHMPDLLFLSRLDPKKNIEALLDAMAILTRRGMLLRLCVAGAGEPDYERRLCERAVALGIAERVMWLGHVDDAAKDAVWADADVFVLPSFTENFGLAAAEAMAVGLPCLLSRGIAIAAEAEHAGAARVCGVTADEIADALAGMITDEDLRTRMSAAALKHARERYSDAAMAQALQSLYGDMIRRGSSS